MAVSTEQTPPSAPPSDREFGPRELVVVHSPDRSAIGRVIALGPGSVVCGREVDHAACTINDTRMSRAHLRIAFDRRGPCHRLGDSQSLNGTFVGGQRIETVALSDGDVIRAGETVFVYRESDLMASVNETADRVASTTLSVLMVGETGTGKEVLARRLHEGSGRKGPFVPVNCAALPRTLAAPELFGHTRGAFSGATVARPGMIQTADRGTLFLDELTDFPFDLQPLLLRALQEKRIRQVGSDRETPVDVRVLAAAQTRIDDAVSTERFRGDLYARLAQAVIVIPPLRARRADVIPLLETFAKKLDRPCALTSDAAEALVRYDWPFNVRELESLVASHAALNTGDDLNLDYLRRRHPAIAEGFRHRTGTSVAPKENPASTPTRKELDELARKHRGNVTKMAKDLNKPRSQVYRWLRAVGIDVSRLRD